MNQFVGNLTLVARLLLRMSVHVQENLDVLLEV